MSGELIDATEFTSHSGLRLPYKIEAGFLSDIDLKHIAKIIVGKFKFQNVYGIPRGGVPLAQALFHYRSRDKDDPWMIVDDVLTAGTSMRVAKAKITRQFKTKNPIGIVIFARGRCPNWIHPFFTVGNWTQE